MKNSNVVIRNRLVQFLLMSLFFTPGYWVAFYSFLPEALLTVELFVSSGMISVALFLIALKFLSVQEEARVEVDRIVFRARRPILFREIKSFSFDDSLTLKVKGSFFVLLLQCSKSQDSYNCLVSDFRMALFRWMELNSDVDVEMPRQKFFYGTWKSILAGCIALAGLACIVMASIKFRVVTGHMVVVVPLLIAASIYFIFSKRRE